MTIASTGIACLAGARRGRGIGKSSARLSARVARWRWVGGGGIRARFSSFALLAPATQATPGNDSVSMRKKKNYQQNYTVERPVSFLAI